MNPFPEELEFKNGGMVGKERTIILTKQFPIVTSLGTFVAPSGFRSDGASIPKLAQSIIGNPFGEYLEDAVGHDLGYSEHNTTLTRKQVDMMLRETMWNRPIKRWKVAAFYLAVRIGGANSFKGSTKNNINEWPSHSPQ